MSSIPPTYHLDPKEISETGEAMARHAIASLDAWFRSKGSRPPVSVVEHYHNQRIARCMRHAYITQQLHGGHSMPAMAARLELTRSRAERSLWLQDRRIRRRRHHIIMAAVIVVIPAIVATVALLVQVL